MKLVIVKKGGKLREKYENDEILLIIIKFE